jgi:hypothetical protein
VRQGLSEAAGRTFIDFIGIRSGVNVPGTLSVFSVSMGEKLIIATVKFILWLTQSSRTIHRLAPVTEKFNETALITKLKFRPIKNKSKSNMQWCPC